MLHMLHHLRCYPPKKITFYKDPFQSPIHKWMEAAGLKEVDPTLIYFSDSAFMDCDERKSTGCHIAMYMGGCLEHVSGCAGILADSTAEAEAVWMAIAAKSSAHIRQAHCQIAYGDPSRPFTVPLITDSRAAMLIMTNGKSSSKLRHVERRVMLPRDMKEHGHVWIGHVPGDKFMLADIGTKNLSANTMNPKTDIIRGDPDAVIPQVLDTESESCGIKEEC
jgi:hypothetical protein